MSLDFKKLPSNLYFLDDIVFVDELPLGATGKVLKVNLRDQFKDHLMK